MKFWKRQPERKKTGQGLVVLLDDNKGVGGTEDFWGCDGTVLYVNCASGYTNLYTC